MSRLKHTSYKHIETFLSNMAEKGTLDGVFGRSIEQWTLFTIYVDKSAVRALIAYCFTQPGANILSTDIEEVAVGWR